MSMVKVLSKELVTKNIRINAVLPGLIETEFSIEVISAMHVYIKNKRCDLCVNNNYIIFNLANKFQRLSTKAI